ncbi:MAG TPA: hypothetical protein VG650_00970 [Mycobacteriales bacterium]|nr:hypothetical protein [Mycobacteriales bacterium]
MTGALVIRWGASVPGREAKGLEVFGKAIETFEGLAKKGRVHGHREYIALTGRAGGFMMADGDVAELQKILVSPEILKLNTQAEAIVSDFEITMYGGGTDQSVQELIGTYTGGLSDLGYM